MIGQYHHSQVAVNPGQQKFSVYKLPNEMSLETSINIIYLSFFSHNVLGCVFMYKRMQKYIQKVSYIQQKSKSTKMRVCMLTLFGKSF